MLPKEGKRCKIGCITWLFAQKFVPLQPISALSYKRKRRERPIFSMKRHIFVIFALLLNLSVVAQEPQHDKFKAFWGKVDKWLCDKYYNISVDTNYITRPQTRWTVKARYNLTGSSINTFSMVGGERLQTHTNNKSKNTISLAGSSRKNRPFLSKLFCITEKKLSPCDFSWKNCGFPPGIRLYSSSFVATL